MRKMTQSYAFNTDKLRDGTPVVYRFCDDDRTKKVETAVKEQEADKTTSILMAFFLLDSLFLKLQLFFSSS
jgi:hypothetical protein